MHREKLRKLLLAYYPQSPQEERDRQACLNFMDNHEDCFERSCLTGHFTGSAWLLNKKRTHALLMHHKKLNGWFQLGGHCDGDSDVLEVSLKEAQEESGIQGIIPLSSQIFDLEIHDIPAYKDVPAHKHYDIRFLLQVQSDEEPIQNHESNGLLWISQEPSTIPDVCQPSIFRLHQKWINRDAHSSFPESSQPLSQISQN